MNLQMCESDLRLAGLLRASLVMFQKIVATIRKKGTSLG